VLTFIDMSHLNYLSRSMSNPATFNKKKKQDMPKDMKQPILEHSSESKESDNESELITTEKTQAPVFSAEAMAREIIDEMVNIVFDAESAVMSDQILSNDLVR